MRVLATGPNYYIRATSFKNERSFFGNNKKQIEYVALEVCKILGEHISNVKSKTKTRELVDARTLISYICREQNYGSFRVIGEYLGGRDHSTIHTRYSEAVNLIETRNQEFIGKLNAVKHLLK